MLRRDEDGRRIRYFYSVDWFSLGCCIYEFITGKNPFRLVGLRNISIPLPGGPDGQGAAASAIGAIAPNLLSRAYRRKKIDFATLELEPVFDEDFDEVAKSLILGLLVKNPKQRIGTKSTNYQDILNHPWFADIDWDHLDSIPPPIVPEKGIIYTDSQVDIGMFSDTGNKLHNMYMLVMCLSTNIYL